MVNMVQGGGVLKGKKKISKAKPPNRHGKIPRTRKGSLVRPPLKASKRKEWEDNRKISKIRNEKGIATAAAQAAGSGERMKMLVAPILSSSSTTVKAKRKKKDSMEED